MADTLNASQDRARIFMMSRRAVYDRVTDCAIYEFEDLIRAVDTVDMVVPERAYARSRKIYTLANQVTQSPKLVNLLPIEFNPVALTQDYDCFFVVLRNIYETLSLASIKNWRRRSKKAACYVIESWRDSWLRKRPFLLEPLKEFDHIFTASLNSVEEIAELTGCPCTYLPLSVDALRFCPYPHTDRSIDVTYIGRRSAVTHQALLDLAEQGGLFYHYDTIRNLEVWNPREHRALYANTLKRCRYFFANHPRVDQPSITEGPQEIGYRYYEGIASGSVILGKPPTSQVFKDDFDWPDAVIPQPFDIPHIQEVLAELDAQPERLARIRQENVAQALLRHDWLYRWQSILATLGLDATPAMADRVNHLQDMAAAVRAQELPSLGSSSKAVTAPMEDSGLAV